MNLSEQEIENLLRRAPVPRTPPGLADRLEAMASQPQAAPHDRNHVVFSGPTSSPTWKRWLPLFLPAVAAAGFSGAFALQQSELKDLQQQVVQLRAEARAAREGNPSPNFAGPALMDERAEIERLRALVKELTAAVADMVAVESENQQLATEVRTRRAELFPNLQAAEELSERSQSIQCINNLKQIGLAVRIFATDNNDQFPMDFLSISNELAMPKVLVCPGDKSRQAAENWGSFTAANVSYEFLSPGPEGHEHEPQRVLARCPVHGHIGLCDGSVQSSVAVKHPEFLVWRNGALYVEPQSVPNAVPADPSQPGAGFQGAGTAFGGVAPAGAGNTQFRMSPELMRRYGLMTLETTNAPEAETENEIENAPQQ